MIERDRERENRDRNQAPQVDDDMELVVIDDDEPDSVVNAMRNADSGDRNENIR